MRCKVEFLFRVNYIKTSLLLGKLFKNSLIDKMSLRLFNFFVDDENLFGDEFKTTTKLPKTTKMVLPLGSSTEDVFKALINKNKLTFDRECYRLCIKKDGVFMDIDSIEDSTIIYYVLLIKCIKTGDDLRRALLNYDKVENLNEKLNSQIVSITGLMMDIKTMVEATGHPLVWDI